MAFAGITYDLVPYTRDLAEFERLILIERLILDVDTDSQDITPTLLFQDTSVTLSAVNSADRDMIEITIDRMGPLNELQLAFDVTDDIQWFNVELFCRPLDLGVNIVPSGQRALFKGRSTDLSASVFWDVLPHSWPLDTRFINPVLRRIWIDAKTGAETITPTIHFADGTTQALTGITAASRTITEYSIIVSKRITRLSIAGDFTNSSVVLYDIEADAYIPARRKMAVG